MSTHVIGGKFITSQNFPFRSQQALDEVTNVSSMLCGPSLADAKGRPRQTSVDLASYPAMKRTQHVHGGWVAWTTERAVPLKT